MIQRIAYKTRHHFSPFFELLIVGRGTGDIIFVNSVAAHSAPLIVICTKPKFGYVFIFSIVKDFCRGEMAVIIYYGHIFGKIIVKLFCCFIFPNR